MKRVEMLLNERALLRFDLEELKNGKVSQEKFIERLELRMNNTDSWLKIKKRG